ncbi:MAG: carboxypeptidase-like regulatory domain-containing protein [bacterium]|jgi:hypothetical protein|nr:carboxypeptidase-like regulatory domain-containing protein [bacterium]
MRNHRKAANPAPLSAASDVSRRINALVFLLEGKGVLVPGEFEDAIMNLKVQLGDQVPANGRPRPAGSGAGPMAQRRGGNDYIGPERRRQLDTDREEGQDRRDSVRSAVSHISGEVVSESDRHPISGVQLILRRSGANNPAIQFRSTKTDMQGRFVFLNLPLAKEAEPDSAYTYLLEVRYRNRTIYSESDVALQPGQTTHHLIQVPQLEE